MESQIMKVVLSCLAGPLVIAGCLALYCAHKLGTNNIFMIMYRLLQVIIVIAAFKIASEQFVLQQLVFIYPLLFVERLTLTFHVMRVLVMIVCMIAVFSDVSVYVVLVMSNLDAILEICHSIYEWQVKKANQRDPELASGTRIAGDAMNNQDPIFSKTKTIDMVCEGKKNILFQFPSSNANAFQSTTRNLLEDPSDINKNIKGVLEIPLEDGKSHIDKLMKSEREMTSSHIDHILPKRKIVANKAWKPKKAPSTSEANSPRSRLTLTKELTTLNSLWSTLRLVSRIDSSDLTEGSQAFTTRRLKGNFCNVTRIFIGSSHMVNTVMEAVTLRSRSRQSTWQCLIRLSLRAMTISTYSTITTTKSSMKRSWFI